MAIWRFRASRKVRLKWRRLSGPTRRTFEYLDFSTGRVRLPRGRIRGSSSSSPRISASSSRLTSTSRRCWPGAVPGEPSRGSPASPSPCPTPPASFQPKRNRGISIWGRGMETTCLPCRPISSPSVRYFRNSFLMTPRTICLNLFTSRSIFPSIGMGAGPSPLLAVPAREDGSDVVEDVGGADVAVGVVLDQPALDDVDLLLGVLVHHATDQAGELDGVLLVLEELQLQGLLQPLVGPVVELLSLQGEGGDVVHDLAPEVVLAALRDVDLLLDGAHQALVGVVLLPGELVPHLLVEGVGLDVVHVVAAEPVDRLLVGGDRLLDLVLDHVLVLLLHHGEELAVALPDLLPGDEAVVGEAGLQLVQDHEGVHAGAGVVALEGVADLGLDVAGADPLHALAGGLLPQLLHVVLREAGEGLARVELHLLDEGDLGLLGLLQAGQDRPHGGHLDGVGGDVLARDLPVVEVAAVDLDLLLPDRVVGDVDLDRAVAEGLHQLVVLQLLVFGLVRVPDDDLVDV